MYPPPICQIAHFMHCSFIRSPSIVVKGNMSDKQHRLTCITCQKFVMIRSSHAQPIRESGTRLRLMVPSSRRYTPSWIRREDSISSSDPIRSSVPTRSSDVQVLFRFVHHSIVQKLRAKCTATIVELMSQKQGRVQVPATRLCYVYCRVLIH